LNQLLVLYSLCFSTSLISTDFPSVYILSNFLIAEIQIINFISIYFLSTSINSCNFPSSCCFSLSSLSFSQTASTFLVLSLQTMCYSEVCCLVSKLGELLDLFLLLNSNLAYCLFLAVLGFELRAAGTLPLQPLCQHSEF
jgi:hypothetical protein